MRNLVKFIETDELKYFDKFINARYNDSTNCIAYKICASLYQFSSSITKLNSAIKKILPLAYNNMGLPLTHQLIILLIRNFTLFKLAKSYKKFIYLNSDNPASVYYHLKYTNIIPTFEDAQDWSSVFYVKESPILYTHFDKFSIDYIRTLLKYSDYSGFVGNIRTRFNDVQAFNTYIAHLTKAQYKKFIDLYLYKVHTELFSVLTKNREILLQFIETFELYNALDIQDNSIKFVHNYQQLAILPNKINSALL